MVKLICNTNSFYVTGSNNLFIYLFPQSVTFTNKSKLGLVSIAVYNFILNVSASRGKNTLTFIWNAQTPVSYTRTIPDGYYSASDLNAWLQSQMFANNLYCSVNNELNEVYFFEIDQNSVRYSLQFKYVLYTDIGKRTTLGYTQPSGATWVFPPINSIPLINL